MYKRQVSRKAVVGQLWRAAKRQIDTHEEHLADLPKGATASEADAKALAVLARTVRELVAIEEPPAARKDKRSDDPSAAAVSYTHLDVYKRQCHDDVI